MSTGKEIRQQVASVENTKKITKAMEMVAASKMRRTKELMDAQIPYARMTYEIIRHVALSHAEFRHPYMQVRNIKRAGYIIVTTDRGLCGGLNSNLLKASVNDIKANMEKDIEIDLCMIGSKGTSFFKRFGGNIVAEKSHIGDTPSLSDLVGVVKTMLDSYLNGKIDALYLCSNEYVSTMKQDARIQQVLPLLPSEDQELKHHWDYIYEPDNASELLEKLMNRYIESQVYRAVTENVACEQAARMLAMRSATDNAIELIANLKLAYNKARQAAITRELSEIVAGASVIEG